MESFGARLKREREKKGITLDDISLSTKIGTRLLRALEEEHFDQLPGGIFNKGFVRAYARHLGLDEDRAVADYLAASGGPVPTKTPEPPPALEPEQPQKTAAGVEQIPWGVLAAALLVIAFGFAIWGFNSREKQREVTEQSVSHAKPTSAAPASPVSAPSTTSAPGSSENPPVAAAPAIPGTTVPTTPADSSGFVVKIKAQDDSWLSITADGQSVMEGTLAAGGEKSILAKKSIAIRAGNAGVLDFYFNGNKLPVQGGEGQVKILTFNENGLELPKPAAPAAESAPQSQ